MIAAKMKEYEFGKLAENALKQAVEQKQEGTVKVSISVLSNNVQNNIIFNNASFIGFTHDRTINDKYIIYFNDRKLKVLYVVDTGRYRQLFLSEV